MLTMATDVVGEMLALKPMAMPRPRRMVPEPLSNTSLSNGFSQAMRCARRSSTGSMPASRITVPVACGRPSRKIFFLRIAKGSMLSALAIMSVWLS